MKHLLLASIISIVCVSCNNSSPYRAGYVVGKHMRMEGRDTAYVVVFYDYGVFSNDRYSAVVPKEAYSEIKKGDYVEFDVEVGKKKPIK
nr:MAG TPA: Cold-shock DNA-binding domain protein [Caudoviricetes sp.]